MQNVLTNDCNMCTIISLDNCINNTDRGKRATATTKAFYAIWNTNMQQQRLHIVADRQTILLLVRSAAKTKCCTNTKCNAATICSRSCHKRLRPRQMPCGAFGKHVCRINVQFIIANKCRSCCTVQSTWKRKLYMNAATCNAPNLQRAPT